MSERKVYDQKCADLAEYFLSEGHTNWFDKKQVPQLATEIQRTVEEWISLNEVWVRS